MPLVNVSEATRIMAASRPAAAHPKITFADLKIRTKDRLIVPFVPNAVQIRYLDLLCPAWRDGDYDIAGLRELILKARQQGFSTLIQAILFCNTINQPNTQTVVIAHDLLSTERIFQSIQLFYDNLPPGKKLYAKYGSKRMYHWPSVNSYYSVGTAGAESFGRGGTINNVHFSEVAFAASADGIVSGLLQAVPVGGNVILESTANGLGNHYQTEWESVGNGESVFRRYFAAWYQSAEYRVDVQKGFKRTDAEEKRAKSHNLTDGQLAWYRGKARELRGTVRQEYPETPEEAFLTSGNPYFDLELLRDLSGHVKPAINYQLPDIGGKLKLASKSLRVYVVPEAGHQYIVSADTAEGVSDSGKADYDSASVWDAESWEQVAHLHGQWDTHEYGLILAELGFWYGTAIIGVERNNHGHAVINAVMHSAGYPLQRPGECKGVYMHKEFDEHKKPLARKPGWPTTVKTKYLALDALATAIIDSDMRINCPETLREMGSFVKLPGGKAGGEAGSHDDRVIDASVGAALLSLRLAKSRRTVRWEIL